MVLPLANSLPTSSPRSRGPITTGLRGYQRRLPPCSIETTRRMGPGLRRDDGVARRASNPAVIARLDRAIQYAVASRLLSDSSGILDPRLRGDDDLRWPRHSGAREARTRNLAQQPRDSGSVRAADRPE